MSDVTGRFLVSLAILKASLLWLQFVNVRNTKIALLKGGDEGNDPQSAWQASDCGSAVCKAPSACPVWNTQPWGSAWWTAAPQVLNFPITAWKPSACLRPDSPCAGDGRLPMAVPMGPARVGEPSGHLGSPRRSHHLKYPSDLGWNGRMELSLCCSSVLSRAQDACGCLAVSGWDADEQCPPAMLIRNNARLNRTPPLKGFGNNVWNEWCTLLVLNGWGGARGRLTLRPPLHRA